MPRTATKQRHGTAYAGLDFIKAAFCPLEFKAMPLKEHPNWTHIGRDKALAALEVADPLTYVRQFPYTTRSGHRRTGTQVVTAAFGLAPTDFDMFLGLYTYLKRLPELPEDGRSHFTADFLARQVGLPADGQASYQRLRSRVFRFSYVKYTSSAFWNREAKTHDIKNFGFYNLAGMSRLTESRRPIEIEWDPSFLKIVREGTLLTFDYDFYRELSPAVRRLYLIANRDGWNQRDSGIFLADDFGVHQIGYSDKPERAKLRRQKLRMLLSDAEDIGLIRPCPGWNGYFRTAASGAYAGRTLLRWSRGPALRKKDERPKTERADLADDALYDQVKQLHDEKGQPMAPATYQRLLSEFGRQRMQRHVLVVLAQKEHRPKTFRRSEVATFIDRLQHDHAEPDWFTSLKKAERVALFDKISPNQLSLEMYGDLFRG